MPTEQIVCEGCDTVNVVTYHPATHEDPGYYGPEADECEGCGEPLNTADAEPVDPYDVGDPDAAYDRGR